MGKGGEQYNSNMKKALQCVPLVAINDSLLLLKSSPARQPNRQHASITTAVSGHGGGAALPSISDLGIKSS